QGQGKGLGSALIDLAEAWAAERWSAHSVRMSVINKREDLIAYYERRGYERTGEVEPFPYGDERFGLPKVDDLEFVLLRKRLNLGGLAGAAGLAGPLGWARPLAGWGADEGR